MILLKKQAKAVTIGDLRAKLQTAIELEHSTIPPYLTANFTLFNANDQSNQSISNVIGSVLGEEMLHMSIACNILNAIGGSPAINTTDFIPTYPGHLPGAVEGSLIVPLAKFSKELIKDVFMEIEEPENAVPISTGVKPTSDGETIGQFYTHIKEDISRLSKTENIFTGNPAFQMVYEDFFPSNILFPITDEASALRAIDIIIDQGEGTSTDPFVTSSDTAPGEVEPAHYYRFEEIYMGAKLVKDDAQQTYSFTGETIPFNASLVANMWPNPKMSDYPEHSVAYENARLFNYNYTCLLNCLHDTFNGQPEKIQASLGIMFSLRLYALKLLSLPDPNHPGYVAGPSFEYLPSL